MRQYWSAGTVFIVRVSISCSHRPPRHHLVGLRPTSSLASNRPFATRGITVFKLTVEGFEGFEEFMSVGCWVLGCWGLRSVIVKVVPMNEWYVHLCPTFCFLNLTYSATPLSLFSSAP